jgi:hypothetical protein
MIMRSINARGWLASDSVLKGQLPPNPVRAALGLD